ncbi:MAG: hypothetical protein ACYTFI_09695, partial [Planctomycetota bacterium]
ATAKPKAPAPAPAGKKKRRRRRSGGKPRPTWSVDTPILVRGMLRARDRLFIVGPKRLYNEQQAIQRIEDAEVQRQVEEQANSLRSGAELLVLSVKDGSEQERTKLDGMVVWDGMAAAGDGVILSMLDGTVLRLRSAGR